MAEFKKSTQIVGKIKNLIATWNLMETIRRTSFDASCFSKRSDWYMG